MNNTMTFWLVRAGKHGEQEQEVLDEGIISIDKRDLPDLSQIKEKEQLKTLYAETYTDEKKMRMANRVGQIWSFLNKINIGDLVAVPLKSQSSIIIGEVTGNYEYKKDSPNTKHRRSVDWKKTIPRSVFDQDILYSLGAFLTVGQVRRENAEQRVRHMLENNVPSHDTNNHSSSHNKNNFSEDDLENEFSTELDLEQISKDSIIKFIERKFLGHDLARLIDGILISKGYTTQLSPPGRDGGIDILAGSGHLGFDDPKICIQVKSSQSPVDVRVLRELDGVTKNFRADYGIIVAWGGLNKIANQEISRSFFTTKLWDQGKIVDELIENYDKLDNNLKSEIPLRKIWTVIED